MIIQTDKMSAPSRELAQKLYEKNIELDSRCRKSAQARIPPDPSIWQQMRENYEAIILEDHAFSEQHNIEHLLWQLHYKKIEELRAHYSAAQASVQGGKGPARPERITKIRLQFKTFLSEATGFYHDLIMKIRSKYGLPLGYFSEDSENRIVMEKDVKKSAEMKKGLISWHRCLIYLGDLARYKGLYGEANSKAREYTAASSYYQQATSLWPSIGNPHHQLAILASYSGDDFLTVYRYFRSLAVENPCSTARDNLVVAFEKNRQSFAQLAGDVNASAVGSADKKRGQEVKPAPKENDAESGALKFKTSGTHDALKSLCIQFVRLNGILFTRTSLETFVEILSLVNIGLHRLLFSGEEGELKFGADARENELFFVRLVAILIFTVHNTKRENEGQTYAEIVQRAVLLQNAFSAAFEIVGVLLERCEQLQNPSFGSNLPGILIFVEWLACCPDLASGSDADEKQSACRSSFWARFIRFTNKLLANGSDFVEDDEDETCFNNMSRYDEGETANRLALSEDFELRGFLPLLPAQTILDFSRNHSFGSDDQKRSSRVKRILAAGKSLLGVVKIYQKTVRYDSKAKQFVLGAEPPQRSGDIDVPADSIMPPASEALLENGSDRALNLGVLHPRSHLHMEVEEEDEVIVFRPAIPDKQADVQFSSFLPSNGLEAGIISASHTPLHRTSPSALLDNVLQQAASDAFLAKIASAQNAIPDSHHMQPIGVTYNWTLQEHESSLANGLKDLRLLENGHVMKSEGQNIGSSHPTIISDPTPQSTIVVNGTSRFYGHANSPEHGPITSRIGAVTTTGVIPDSLIVKTSQSPPPGLKKNPVSRPVRHVGPPPGFGPVYKKVNGHVFPTPENPINDDYSWLDGYHWPSHVKAAGLSNSSAFLSHANSHYMSAGSTGFEGSVGFPFPGKQVQATQLQIEGEKGHQNYPNLDLMKLQQEQHMRQASKALNGNHEVTPQPEQHQGSVWAGRFFV